MALPSSPDAIGMQQIVNAYLAPNKTPLTALVSNGEFVPGAVTGFPGENIPSSPPISLFNFYDAGFSVDQVAEANFNIGSAASGGTVHLLNEKGGGLYVATNLGGASVSDEASFIIDIQIKLSANNDEPFFSAAINGTTNVFFGTRAFGLGIVKSALPVADISVVSNATRAALFMGWMFDFMRSDLDTHYVRRYWGNVNSQHSTFNETGADYEDDVLPTKTLTTTIRVERGDPGGGGTPGVAIWRYKIYSDRTGWTTVWDTSNSSTSQYGNNDPNSGGYLCLYNTDGFGSNYDVNIEIVKAVVGTKVVPWP